MRALLASPLGFIVGLSLGALGGGGSILAVPALVYVAGQDPRAATGTSLVLVGVASVVGMVTHHRSGRVRVGTGVVFGAAGIGGSVAGSALNRHLDPDLLLLAFSGLVLVAAHRMATGCPGCTRRGTGEVLASHGAAAGGTGGAAGPVRTAVRHRSALSTAAVVLAAGTGVGFLTGLFGVGGGFVIVPALALVLRMPMPEAIGTSLLVIAINSASALVARLATTTVDWSVTLPFTVAAVAGVVAGERVAGRLDGPRSARAFAGLLVAVAVYTAVRAGLALGA